MISFSIKYIVPALLLLPTGAVQAVESEQPPAEILKEHEELLKIEQRLVKEITGSVNNGQSFSAESPRLEPQVREFTPPRTVTVSAALQADVRPAGAAIKLVPETVKPEVQSQPVGPVTVKAASQSQHSAPESQAPDFEQQEFEKEEKAIIAEIDEKRRARDRAISQAVKKIVSDLPETTVTASLPVEPRAQLNPQTLEENVLRPEAEDYVISRKVVYIDQKDNGHSSTISIKPQTDIHSDHALNERTKITFKSYDDNDDMWAGEQVPLFYNGRADRKIQIQVEKNTENLNQILEKQEAAEKREESRFTSLEEKVARLAEQNDKLLAAIGGLQAEKKETRIRSAAPDDRPVAIPVSSNNNFLGGYNEQVNEATGTVLFDEVPGYDGPGNFYTRILRFERGVKVTVVSVRDGWAQIKTEDGKRAWVRATDMRFS